MVNDPFNIQVAFLIVIDTQEISHLQIRKELVNRVVSSSLICKSARLRELFLYLCNRVLDESVDDIHELELGHKVFGRPEHYDTATDNIVRVHASLLRKRLAEHFQTEGINEPLIVEIPRGNDAPTFRKRAPFPRHRIAWAARSCRLAARPDFSRIQRKFEAAIYCRAVRTVPATESRCGRYG
jgi:hypothetical protein